MLAFGTRAACRFLFVFAYEELKYRGGYGWSIGVFMMPAFDARAACLCLLRGASRVFPGC